MNQLSTKEMADGLKVPPSRVSEWRGRNMPMTSIDAAAAWRRVHAPPRGKNARKTAQMPQDKPVAPATDTGWEARLDRARTVEAEIFDTLRKALAQGDVNVLGKLQAAHVASIKEIAAAEKIALEVRVASRALVPADNVRQLMREVVEPLRRRLDLLPVQERAACNPDHPEIAEEALKNWLTRTLVMVATAETKFK
jgi:hypothetical protein